MGNPTRRMYWFTRMLTVLSAVNSGIMTANISARRTEAVGDEKDLGVASRRDRRRAEVVDTDGDGGTFRERHGDD